MNAMLRRFLIAAISFGVATTTLAQGRHDEKPHGSAKPAADSGDTERKAPPGVGGRHDERPHGTVKKQKPKKSKASSGEEKIAK